MANNPVKVNPLGQIADGVVEQLKGVGSTAASTVVKEPAKILEQILGGQPQVEQKPETQPQEDLVLKRQESAEKSAEAYKFHQQRLAEEIEFAQRRKQETIQQAAVEQQQEAEKQEIIQLQKEKQDDVVWQQQLKAVQGSHEGQQGKM